MLLGDSNISPEAKFSKTVLHLSTQFMLIESNHIVFLSTNMCKTSGMCQGLALLGFI